MKVSLGSLPMQQPHAQRLHYRSGSNQDLALLVPTILAIVRYMERTVKHALTWFTFNAVAR